MDVLKANIPHMVMGVVAIAAVTLMACLHLVSGGEALGIIGAAAGFSMGVGGNSASTPGGVVNTPAVSPSPGQTVTETITHSAAVTPAPIPGN